ncbi:MULTISPECIES: ABC transporter ATP-binding protein [Bifidobacterium]|uniref:ABC transporter ATP-binding protein n=1 Tax=Bifidobacterium TaxID=1678 RepID=UPI001BDD260F|nr:MULTISPECIES: ATP-binding cassette domain-containing protein [Bifidobacterium]MBT1162707.1 ATP-binding cassette domain-containing protein [Bifidobacterium sp. SO1]MBW3079369.1 ATP-binding cassette domain-containing protein [Bifidobacterium simiiventris]
MIIITCRNLSTGINGHVITGDINLDITPGTMTALTGPSDCGKTTLLHTIGLLQTPTAGTLAIDGIDTTGWNQRQRRRFWRDKAAFILQDYGIMDEETVGFNVSMRLNHIGLAVGGDRRRIRNALRLTGLAGRSDEIASHLSGGEKQRLGIARAIYKNASIILADEPTASLDAGNRANIIRLLRERAAQGASIILATHDPVLVDACDHVYHVNSHPDE